MTSGTGAIWWTLTPSARPDSASSASPLRYASGSTSAGRAGSAWPSSNRSWLRVHDEFAFCTAATAWRMMLRRSAPLGSSLGACSAACSVRRFVERGQLPGSAPLRLPGPRLHPLAGGRRVVVLRGARLQSGLLPDLVPGRFARSVAVLPLVGVRELAGPVPQLLRPGGESVGGLVADPADLERRAVLAEHGPVAEKLQLLGQEPVGQGGEPEPFPEQRLAVKRPPFIVRSVQAAGPVRYGVVHVELGHPVPASLCSKLPTMKPSASRYSPDVAEWWPVRT